MTKQIFAAILLIGCWISSEAQVNNVGIGTTTPDPSAILELQSTNQGFLLPRMDQSGEDAIVSPLAQGLLIYNTQINNIPGLSGVRFYDGALWGNFINQKSTGEIPLFNITSNYFSADSGSNYDFQLGGSSFYEISFAEHHFKIADNSVLKLKTTGSTNYVEITDNAVESFDNAGTRQDLELNNGLTVKADGDITVNDNALIRFQRFNPNTTAINYNTGVSATIWNAGITGFHSGAGDFSELTTDNLMYLYLFISQGTWYISKNIHSHNTHENWPIIDVMFVRKEISERIGF